MTDRICSVEDCDRVVRGKGYCRMHYGRWLNHGNPLVVRPSPPDRGCSIEGCDRQHAARGLCATHHRRWRKHGDPNIVKVAPVPPQPPPHPGPKGSTSPSWKGSAASYNAVHTRLRVQRGPAKSYTCDCGKRARDWAYDHSDPEEKIDIYHGLPYSIDLDRYMPLCSACHKQFDALFRKQQKDFPRLTSPPPLK